MEGITFNEIIERYTFDRKLRLLIFEAIERVEIGLRTNLVYHLSHQTNDWNWFGNFEHFKNRTHFNQILKSTDRELNQTKQYFIKKYYEDYGDNRRPPCLKTLEIVSFGTLSKLYYNLKNMHPSKASISNSLGLSSVSDAESWLRTISSIRNKVAHHSRIWNEKLPFRMSWLSNPKSKWIARPDARGQQRIYYFLSCIIYMLEFISPGHKIKLKIIQLLNDKPKSISHRSMGFPNNWNEQDLWK